VNITREGETMERRPKESEGSNGGSVRFAPPTTAGRAAALAETQHELVGGIDQNIRKPDAEAANTATEALASETRWELGDSGAAGEASEFAPVDAIYGSYPSFSTEPAPKS
jgi:hypothetical protein